ncbi:MAG: bifunctional phosphoribosylaminoimidazolecarboxamide formyltransferase/IMP cyclohydrolase [Kiritimatiellae bacterium]|nr:bifunctional phosphoribosylaminoimidazolecarboxamide formyltransferase/IMP cyclohydrolase [Kiritimatiellia bacterium]MDD4341004.1 bifunctional phosphoribosylaminoimidazolecarboxamide formyltransferase/IMP cyclohydrolase [Kiritimatiellia bacterium]
MKLQRALLSVSDKTGLVDFARGLSDLGIELLSTGGTAKGLRDAGLPVIDIASYTGHPEILNGRVKTLHPKVHGGILQRRGLPADQATCAQLDIPPIDLVCVNLYPFEQTPSIEQIDIGGPTLLRSAAKNHTDVLVLCDPQDYPAILAALQRDGDLPVERRRELARKVFARVAAYDAAIAAWLAGEPPPETALRYGENPHQTASFRPDSPPPAEATLATARILHGKDMSFNNYVDGDAALEAVREFHAQPAAVIVKHTNPCGAATGDTLAAALAEAWEGDVVSAFGSVIAVTRPVDLAAAQVLKGRFVEALIAPAFEPDALAFLQAKSKDIRLISLDAALAAALPRRLIRPINGGVLTQDADQQSVEGWKVVSRAPFPETLRPTADFGIRMGRHLKSNAIVLAWEYAPGYFSILGMGAGQPNRVDAMKKLALVKAHENMQRRELDSADVLARTVLVSDAFFPFADNIDAAAEFGITHIVEPGGSKRDADCIAAANAAGIALVFTGCRHFRH